MNDSNYFDIMYLSLLGIFWQYWLSGIIGIVQIICYELYKFFSRLNRKLDNYLIDSKRQRDLKELNKSVTLDYIIEEDN